MNKDILCQRKSSFLILHTICWSIFLEIKSDWFVLSEMLAIVQLSVIYPRKNGTETSKHLNAIYVDVLTNSKFEYSRPFFCPLRNEKRYRELSKFRTVLGKDGKNYVKRWVLWKLLLSRLPLARVEQLRTASTLKLLTNISWNKWSVNFSNSLREYAIFVSSNIWRLWSKKDLISGRATPWEDSHRVQGRHFRALSRDQIRTPVEHQVIVASPLFNGVISEL